MNQIKLKIITPQGIFYNGMTDLVTVKTTEGNMGIMANHIPVVASLTFSKLSIDNSATFGKKVAAIAGGLLYVTGKEVNIITDGIQYKEKIDLAKTQRELNAIENKLKLKTAIEEEAKLHLQLKRVQNLMNISKG